MTAQTVAEYDAVLCVGDTTFLDYDKIVPKREGYGPIGIQVLWRGWLKLHDNSEGWQYS